MCLISYFLLISDQLLSIQGEAPWGVQVRELVELLNNDVDFLIMFCGCLATWDCPTTHLRVIWTKEHKGRQSILNRLFETWPVDVQSFHSLAFQLEGIIQQSKLQIGGWCNNNLVHYSSTQCIYSTFDLTQGVLHILQTNMNKKILPIFKKQVDTLKNKIVFLKKSLDNVESCKSSESLEFVNFVHAFANSAACLTCLYWAKEDNEETVTELKTVLFNMLHKFIPSAPQIAPLYIGILKSNNLQPSDSFLPGVAAESFVDFFFDHLATILKDKFLILRDRLIFLFTFLIDPPCENAEAEDLIFSLIYALFQHEDAYLLLPFAEMKKDFLHDKTLLSDCMIKIETASAKIRQLYCGFSDSWIRLEVEKMDYIYFVSVQRELSSIEKHARWTNQVLEQVRLYKTELRFLRVVLLCFGTWDDSDEEIRVRLSFMITSLQGIWEKEEENGPLAVRLHAICTGDVVDWHPLAFDLVGKIQQSKKLQIEAWCVDLLHWSFLCKPSIRKTSKKIINFLDPIIDNLNDLVIYRTGKIVLFKKQIETLKEKLVFLQNMLKLNANCTDSKELEEFNMFVQVFAKDAACLTFLYWAKEASDKIATELNLILSRMLQKIRPVTPNIAGLYFGALKAIYSQRSESLLFGHTAVTFIHFFLEDPATPLKDEFQILEEDIIFLLSFLNDPPNRNAEEIIGSQIDVLFWEGVYGLLPFDDMEEDFSKKKVILSDFMFKIETVNSNIRQLYCKFPDSSVYNLPKVVSPRFLDFLIHNLRNLEARMLSDKKYVPFAKYKIKKIVEELVCLVPFFNHIVYLQSEPNDTWFQVVDLIHLIEHVINSCIRSWFDFDRPIWYYMANLSDVLDRIKVVNTNLETDMYNARCLPHSIGFISTLSEQARTSEINEVVGIEDEAEKIIGKLTWEYMPLDTVSIVGMGGLGKTTLAKKIYGSWLVKSHFDIFAFCTVSQEYNTKRLLLDILCDIKGDDKKFSKMTNDDLAHQLWKCLSRQRYLIVLDDIWNESVWNEIKRSFPDHENGSRILFTTRSYKVAYKCKIKCSPHHLRFLTKDESWELLRKKVFHNDISPPNLYEIGKVIAENCKGLPLAVVVIAGVLARIERRESLWSEIAERVGAYLSEEGCMSILELSYTHLPNYLKPCFLYLGAFPEDELFRVKQVILLWIAEGFVQESETKSLEDVAKEYLRNLLDRSLVIVGATSSSGEIKTFRVHDLIHDLCRMKCRDGDFFQLIHGTAKSGSSDHSLHSQYRVSMTMRRNDDGSSLFNAHTLILFYGGDFSEDFFSDDFSTEFKHVKVLYTGIPRRNFARMTSLLHVRHLEDVYFFDASIPKSISNIWNMQSLILSTIFGCAIEFPETLWRMKSLRHVKVSRCKLTFSDGFEEHDESYPKLDKVVRFSNPILYSGEDVQQLLQRLPAVRGLSCILDKSLDSDEGPGETLDFYRKQLESLKLRLIGPRKPYLIKFPTTLKKLTLNGFQLPWTAISAVVELRALQVLKLQWISFPEPRLEMEDVAFKNLKFFELHVEDLVQWGASDESFPCLEQLLIECQKLEALPPCFRETPTLKKIVVRSKVKGSEVESSALQIREEQRDAGNEVEVSLVEASYPPYDHSTQKTATVKASHFTQRRHSGKAFEEGVSESELEEEDEESD